VHLLLDTHALIWWMTGSDSLTRTARANILDKRNVVVVSAVSAWEMATKVRLGRLPITSDVMRDFSNYMVQSQFQDLSITAEHGIQAGFLPGPLRDPFDRMLIAQAQAERLSIVSNETIFDHYGVRRIW
jgi:PIN domain nuclease of toxin-antitoxin system